MTNLYVATELVRQQQATAERQARAYLRRHPEPAVELTDGPSARAPVARWRRSLRVVFTHG